MPVEISQLAVRDLPARISIRNRGTPETPVLAAINDYYGPVEVEISAEALKNMRAEPPLPMRVVVPARTELTAVTPGQSARVGATATKYERCWAIPPPRIDPNSPYAPPFAPGATVPHQHSTVASATNIRRAVTRWISACRWHLVRAARAGIIMEVAGDFFDGGTDPKYQSRANAVRVLHDDGTMAVYAHLHPDSIQVAPGQRVKRGTWLANPVTPVFPPARTCTSQSSATRGWNWSRSPSSSPDPTEKASPRSPACC